MGAAAFIYSKFNNDFFWRKCWYQCVDESSLFWGIILESFVAYACLFFSFNVDDFFLLLLCWDSLISQKTNSDFNGDSFGFCFWFSDYTYWREIMCMKRERSTFHVYDISIHNDRYINETIGLILVLSNEKVTCCHRVYRSPLQCMSCLNTYLKIIE